MKTDKCDYKDCKNKAYAELYFDNEKGLGWGYVCRKHFYFVRKREKDKIGWWVIKEKKNLVKK